MINDKRKSGVVDLLQALTRREIWLYLGWQDIRQRYRRSVLGPFWLTISTGVQIGALGFLWAELFHQDLHDFLPFFSIGLVIWSFFSGVILEACTGFTQFEAIIRQTALPFSSYLLRILFRHLVILAHNFVIIVLVLALTRQHVTWTTLLCLPGLLMASFLALFLSGPIAIFCARFRDMPQILSNLVNVLYYFTPIMWRPSTLARMPWVYELNPLHHLFEVVRAPLLGSVPTIQDYAWTGASICLAGTAYILLLGRFRHRIAYWI